MQMEPQQSCYAMLHKIMHQAAKLMLILESNQNNRRTKSNVKILDKKVNKSSCFNPRCVFKVIKTILFIPPTT